eukprot:UN04039
MLNKSVHTSIAHNNLYLIIKLIVILDLDLYISASQLTLKVQN